MTICLFPDAPSPMAYKREASSHPGKGFDDAKVLTYCNELK